MRFLTLLLLPALLVACATPPDQREPAPFAPSRGVVATADLPAGHVVVSGDEPVYLRLAGTDTLVLEPADEASADLVVHFASRDHDMTMVSLKAKGERTLRLDFYISPDGKRWQYSSSCPLMGTIGTYENWPHALPLLAIANPRYIDGDDRACK